MSVMVVQACSFCGLDNYVSDGLHPCCEQAQALGEERCSGCEAFRKRWQRGETCPHVTGTETACCRPMNGRQK